MAGLNVTDCAAAYLALHACLKDLLVLAKNGAWDEFEVELQRYQLAVAHLPQVEWQNIPVKQQQQFAALLREVQIMQDELIVHSQSRQDELAEMLQGLHNAGKLDKAYRM